jgi:hypothetical protein
MKKCDSIVRDPFHYRKRKCMLNFKYTTSIGNFCHVHARKFVSCYAIQIQKIWKRYRNNKKLNALFFPLPRDLQLKVLFHIKEPYLLEKYQYSFIRKFVDKRVVQINTTLIHNYYNLLITELEVDMLTMLINTSDLLIKYNEILEDDTFIKFSRKVGRVLYRSISQRVEEYNYWTSFYNNIITLNKITRITRTNLPKGLFAFH